MTSSIRLLIVDDHRFFRRGLRQVCELEANLEVVAEAGNGQEAIELARRWQPDVILMDIEMPVLNGVQATRLISEANPSSRIIVLTVYEHDEYVFEAIRAGAHGYLLKDSDEDTLIAAIRAIYRGDVLIDAQVAARVLEEFRRLGQAAAKRTPLPPGERIATENVEQLTEGELAVLRRVARGEDNDTIARQLNLSEKTVTNRLSVIYQKLRVNSRVQATLYALRHGWTSLEDE